MSSTAVIKCLDIRYAPFRVSSALPKLPLGLYSHSVHQFDWHAFLLVGGITAGTVKMTDAFVNRRGNS